MKKKIILNLLKKKNRSLPKRKNEGVYMSKFIKQKIDSLFKLDSLENQGFGKCCMKLHFQIKAIEVNL